MNVNYISHAMTDEEFKAKKFGLPKVKKFPMPDAAHVKSAIKFFNYAKPSQEKELANAILTRMDEYGIDPSSINVGDDNRFKRYFEQSYLKHHGILGMKWGVRRYQNPDGTYTSEGKRRRNDTELRIRSGEDLIRISKKNDISVQDGMYYSLASRKDDTNRYIGLYADFMKKTGKNVMMQVLETNGDMVMPSHKKSVSMMKDTLDSLNFRNDIRKQQMLKQHFKQTDIENASEDSYFRKARKEFDIYIKTGNVGNNLYDCLNVDFAFRSSPIMQDISNKFYATCRNNGYDIVKDINDFKYGDIHARLPLILTNASKVKIKDIRQITDDDILNARKNLNNHEVTEWDNNSPV